MSRFSGTGIFHTPSTSVSPGRQARYSSGPFLSIDDRQRDRAPGRDRPIDQRPRIELGAKRPIHAENTGRARAISARSSVSIALAQARRSSAGTACAARSAARARPAARALPPRDPCRRRHSGIMSSTSSPLCSRSASSRVKFPQPFDHLFRRLDGPRIVVLSAIRSMILRMFCTSTPPNG